MDKSTRNAGQPEAATRRRPSESGTAILAFLFGLMIGAAGVAGVFTLAANMPSSLAERSTGPGPDGTGVSFVGGGIESVRLVLQRYPSARAGDPGWDLHRTLVLDLNGDGREETVHVIASVERAGGGAVAGSGASAGSGAGAGGASGTGAGSDSGVPGSRADEFMWDDGHVWNVYIEDEDGNVTEVFRGWVQLGELRVRSLDPFAEGTGPGLLLLQEEGAGITMYRVFYDGPGRVRAEKLAGASTWSEAW